MLTDDATNTIDSKLSGRTRHASSQRGGRAGGERKAGGGATGRREMRRRQGMAEGRCGSSEGAERPPQFGRGR